MLRITAFLYVSLLQLLLLFSLLTSHRMRVNYDQYYDLGLWKASETGTGFEKTQLLIELREARDNLFSWAKEFAG
jgi:hypothetical protein